MAVKEETQLQERIQRQIVKRGGYVVKNHGDMISEPGIADLTICYKGYYIAMEVKVGNNTPSKQQGIHCRKVWAAGGIACVVWSLREVELLLFLLDMEKSHSNYIIKQELLFKNSIDDGTRW